VKKLCRKTLAQDVFDRSFDWLKRYTNQNISARSSTSFIFAVGWALRGRPQPEHESVMPSCHCCHFLC